MKSRIYLSVLTIFSYQLHFSQDTKNSFPNGVGISVSGYITIHGGSGISAAFGFWKSYHQIQYSTNISIKGSFGKNNLGCRDKDRTRTMFNVIFSPMITFDPFNDHKARYECVNPFYYGFASGVFNNFKDAFTIGTSFVAYPRSNGVNILSARNRAQQLMYFQIKAGLGQSKLKDNVRQTYYGPTFMANLYEDFLFTDNPCLQWWADNRDRFFTGGANIQLRMNDYMLLKLYWDVYTGSSYAPDATHYRDVDIIKTETDKNGNIRRVYVKNYAYQEPDQKQYNKARFFGVAEIQNLDNRRMNLPVPNIEVLIGATDGNFCMEIQNFIHNWSKEHYLNGSTNTVRRKHFFMPAQEKTKQLYGIGVNYSFY